MLSAVPGTLSFNHAAELFQGLVNLNPRKVEYLLSVSQSVQAKRFVSLLRQFFTSMAGSNESIAKNRSGSGQAANRGKWKVQCSIPNHSA
ncbi:Ynd [Klebsiella pneumoniae ISC21]|nr:Ynd [Klebsiella pneumoniae ISC21]